MNVLANIISFLHLVFILFVTITPFVIEHPVGLLYYCFILFFLGIHWYTNDDTCVLTIIESKLRGKKSTDTFMGKLISPIYKISDIEIHIFTAFLFLFALYKSKIWKEETRDLIGKVMYFHYRIFKKNVIGFISPEMDTVKVSADRTQ
jgi:hypothetical protein